MHDAAAIERIQQKYGALDPVMDERLRRQWAASEANALGWGGVSLVARATGLARNTVAHGVRELAERAKAPNAPVPALLLQPKISVYTWDNQNGTWRKDPKQPN